MRISQCPADVRWWDIEGPEKAKLTVGWLDDDGRTLAWDIRGLHAYYIAQCFRARDATIKQLRDENAALYRDLAAARAQRDQAVGLLRAAVGALVAATPFTWVSTSDKEWAEKDSGAWAAKAMDADTAARAFLASLAPGTEPTELKEPK